ncbi:MAG: SpoIIE family protein phosphatase [Clostridia bacterium]|nr:SpoIIE family protein phosphatase [Clostridia bacterium]
MPLKINLKSVLTYAVYTVVLVLLNKALDGVPLSLGLYFAMLLCGANVIVTPVLYVAASAVHVNLILSLLSLFEGAFLAAVTFLYRRSKRKISFEAIAYLAIALSLYVAFAPWKGMGGLSFINSEYGLKAIAAAVCAVFAFFCFKTVYAVIYRVNRCKLREEELVCCAVVFAAAGTGLYNLTGFFVYTAFAAGMLIFFVRLTRSPAAVIAALALALPPALTAFTPAPLTAYVIAATFVLLFSGAGRFVSGAVGLALAALYCYFKGGFDCSAVLIVFRALLLLIIGILPAIPPDSFYKKLKNSLLVKEVLPDTAVERSRRRTSEKLYRISEVFREIECAFSALDEDVNDKSARERILEDLKEKCCKNCERRRGCAKTSVYSGFKKLIDTGSVKGKVSLIDLPSEVTQICSNPSDVLKQLNLMIADYRRYMTEVENAKSGRALLAEQARGVAEVMKSCAVDLCKSYNEFTELEEAIKSKLSSHGISCPELYISSDDGEVIAVTSAKSNVKAMAEVISEITKRKYLLKDKLSYDGDKCSFIFGAPPRLDAAFGVAYAIKSGEKVSGDTHSVIKINEHSFLMALSDGMGSGEYAKKVSATAISLIEAFYRAEMPEGTVLNTINKLLSFNRDERFTCIDVAAVNLNTGSANFVKIGSPAGIIVREGEIKVLESQSLPMGILDNLRPTVCTEMLKNGDIVVFMSDGITSAFASQSDLYEYLQELKPLNPQALADKILAEAKTRLKNSVSDDMTVLCTRIFEK